jgi:A/G-specific adenine glycosylase
LNRQLFTKQILDWYYKNKRELPWRNTRDPFKIWLSEVIMQQTRVSQGLPYFRKFDDRFSTVKELAESSEEEVLQLWQGLGYYSRGRNLLEGAKMIMDGFNGQMPGSYEELLKVKGIGKYTGAAIASIAYNEPVACVDGNVSRVLSRVFGIEDDLAFSSGQKKIYDLAQDLVSREDPGGYNQAVMEFGALQCTPRKPACMECIFQENCFARIHKKQKSLPYKSRKIRKTDRFIDYVLFTTKEKYLLKKREGNGIWEGLYDFYALPENGENRDEEGLAACLAGMQLPMTYISSRDYRHILSHQNLITRITRIKLNSLEDLEKVAYQTKTRPFSKLEMSRLPKPVLINKYLNDEIF